MYDSRSKEEDGLLMNAKKLVGGNDTISLGHDRPMGSLQVCRQKLSYFVRTKQDHVAKFPTRKVPVDNCSGVRT